MNDRRYFRYVGHEVRIRGDHGPQLRGGRAAKSEYGANQSIYAFDPDCGEIVVGRVGDADFVEVTHKEWATL